MSISDWLIGVTDGIFDFQDLIAFGGYNLCYCFVCSRISHNCWFVQWFFALFS